jgi:hypothetical protein
MSSSTLIGGARRFLARRYPTGPARAAPQEAHPPPLLGIPIATICEALAQRLRDVRSRRAARRTLARVSGASCAVGVRGRWVRLRTDDVRALVRSSVATSFLPRSKGGHMTCFMRGIAVNGLGFVLALAAGADAGAQTSATVYRAELAPLNAGETKSRASGEAIFSISGDQMTIRVQVSGASPNIMHLQHFHGFATKAETARARHRAQTGMAMASSI